MFGYLEDGLERGFVKQRLNFVGITGAKGLHIFLLGQYMYIFME